MKKCAFEGCEIDIEDWQVYCVDHYIKTKNQPAQSPVQKQPQSVQQPASAPQQQAQPNPVKQMKSPQVPPQSGIQQPAQQPVAQAQPQPKLSTPQQHFEMPELSERERLIVKQVAFKGAIHLMSQQDFLDRSFDTLIDEIRTLTIKFYQLITEKSEGAELL